MCVISTIYQLHQLREWITTESKNLLFSTNQKDKDT